MRKIYLTLAVMFAFGWASAQMVEQGGFSGIAGKQLPNDLSLNTKAMKHYIESRNATAKTGTNERWYNYGSAVDNFLSGIAEFSYNNLFPDTSILVDYGTSGFSGPWIHKLGDILDVTVPMYNSPVIDANAGELKLDVTSTYILDSVEIWGLYYRGTKSPTSVDTILINIALKERGQSVYRFGGTLATNLGTDTVFFPAKFYDQPRNAMKDSAVTSFMTIKVPMTAASENDTLENGVNFVKVPVNLSIPANKLVYLSYEFIPGYSWVANYDTLTSFNRWRFLSFDENPDQFPTYTKRDYNVSEILPQDVRINDAGSWNGWYIPSFAYMGGATNTYSYTHHCVFYKIHGVTNFGWVNINDQVSANDLLGNAYPNPVSQGTQLVIPVKANNATLTISDVIGKQIMSIGASNMVDGNAIINTASLTPGLYFYTLSVDNVKVSKKFVVTK